MNQPPFIPGLELSRRYYEEVVRPILQQHHPALVYSAALIGPGSEVLGFDTEMSADHSWGPRLTLFLTRSDHERLAAALHDTFANHLPFTFYGYPTQLVPIPDDPGSKMLVATDHYPIRHHMVQTAVLHDFVHDLTGIDLAQGPTLMDWLLVPEQMLLTLTAGAVFHDALGVLASMRRRLAYYPHDLWRYLLSAQWQRLGQEEPLAGRAGIVGDETGSAVIAARLVRGIMQLCFFLEQRYAPYPKWFGTAFARLSCASELAPHLRSLLQAAGWQERQRHFAAVYATLARLHNARQLTAPIPTTLAPFHNRPFHVMHGEAVADQIWEGIRDPAVRALPRGVGKVDQFVDNVDVLSHVDRFRRLYLLYGADGNI